MKPHIRFSVVWRARCGQEYAIPSDYLLRHKYACNLRGYIAFGRTPAEAYAEWSKLDCAKA